MTNLKKEKLLENLEKILNNIDNCNDLKAFDKCFLSFWAILKTKQEIIKFEGEAKMAPNCKDCENKLLMELAELGIKLDKAENHIDILNRCLDVKEELCQLLREENEELRNKLKVYIQHIENNKSAKNERSKV